MHVRSACDPDHKLDHGVPDPKYDYCKLALAPLYRLSALKEAGEIPIWTFDLSGLHPSTVHDGNCLVSKRGAFDMGSWC